MKVLLFGSLADVVGKTRIEIESAGNTAELKQLLLNKYPRLVGSHFQLAVNQSLVAAVAPLNAEDEIALLPPFAGG